MIYLAAAVLPAVFLMRYVYKKDKVEKEPIALLLLAAGGVGAALCSIALETIGMGILDAVLAPDSPAYIVTLAFLVVAAVEEGTKFLFLYRISWRNPNFDFRFDGIVYAVFVSLGFAAFENVRYVMGYGLSVAMPRALLAIPAHMGFAVFMGSFYGRGKLCQTLGDYRGCGQNLFYGYLLALSLHGFYDACAMFGNVLSTILFAAFVIVMYIVVIRRVRRESETDEPVA